MDYLDILNRIKKQNISESEIKNLECSEILKLIIFCAFYEFNGLEYLITKTLKVRKKEYENDVDASKIISQLIERNKQKRKIFSIEFFEALLLNILLKTQEDIKILTENHINKISGYVRRLGCSEKIGEALEICQNPLFQVIPEIQSKHIKILRILGRIDEALEICQNPLFLHENYIQHQHIEILISLGRIDEALAIATNEIFANDLVIQGLINQIQNGNIEESRDGLNTILEDKSRVRIPKK